MRNLYTPLPALLAADNIYRTAIPGLYYLSQSVLDDERGFFAEVADLDAMERVWGQPFKIKQINHSRSRQDVVRGMHAEDWNKVVTVISGVAFCALADVRPHSPAFLRVETFLLGHGGGAQSGALFVERGIANSFCVVAGPVDYVYGVDRLYSERDPAGDQAISVFDPDLGIAWPIEREQMVLSARDRQATTLRALFPEAF